MHVGSRVSADRAPKAPAAAQPQRSPIASSRSRPTPAQAVALQRTAGNRATTRMLSRWAKHPDPTQKGVMVPDVVAEELPRAMPPQNK